MFPTTTILAATVAHGAEAASPNRNVLDAAVAILLQGEQLLAALTPAAYARRMPVAFNASIGGHYRHCLDHFACLLDGRETGEVDYDHRERDARVEQQPEFALERTRDLRIALERLLPATLALPVTARCEVSYARGESSVTGSSLGRELVYVIAHAIHHYALIAVMARLSGATLPENFGIAPSTVAYQSASQSTA